MRFIKDPVLLGPVLAHFTNDFYTNLLPVMFPLLVSSLGLSYGQTGLVVALATATSSLTQPIFGYLTDRFRPRFWGLLGMFWAATFMILAGYSWSYPILAFFVACAALGSAAFHPQGAMSAAISGGERRGTSVALFTLAGNTGFALGPLVGGMVLARTGLQGSALLIIPALAMAPLLFRITQPLPLVEASTVNLPNRLNQQRGALALFSLAMLVILRPWADLALVNFLPLFLQERELSLTLASQILFLLLIGRATGGLIAGFLSDRVGFRPVLITSLLSASPVLYLFLRSSNPALLALPLGMLLGAALPISIVLAQDLLPERSGLASGLAFGSTFVAGGIGTAVTGALADQFGLLTGLQFLIPLPFIAALFSLGIPKAEKRMLGSATTHATPYQPEEG